VPKTEARVTRKRRQRGSINADDIVAGAFALAQRISLDQMSMPLLAENLDVGVTSIYWYFRKKEDLLNAMTDVAADKFARLMPEVRAEDSWQETLAARLRAERDLFREDEILSDLLLIRTSTYSREATHRVMELVEAMVAKLITGGFTPDNAVMVFCMADLYNRGSIITDRILRMGNSPATDTARQRRMTDWSQLPVLDSLVDRHPLSGTSDEDFEFGVARLIAGFEQLLREQDGQPRKTPRASGSARRAMAEKPKAAAARQSSARKAASRSEAATGQEA
jgi:AcrR family transcriptional regulator